LSPSKASAPPFKEKKLSPNVVVFYNPSNVEADIEDERFHAHYLDYQEVFRLKNTNRNLVKKVEFDDIGSSRSVLQQKFHRWAAKGKYQYLCALYWLMKAPDGRTQQRLTVMAAYDYGHYLKLQNGLFEFMAIYQLSGDIPIKGIPKK